LYFKSLYGTNKDSGLSFPETKKIADAYEINYISAKKNCELEKVFTEFLNHKDAIICEIFCKVQQRCPKLSSIKNDDGTFTSRPYEDMEPLLSREEFYNEMIVKSI